MGCGLKYVSETRDTSSPDTARVPNLILADSPFKPHGVGTSSEQIKVTEDRCPSVLVIQEFIHEDVH